ncbi:hypothetical protein O71_13219 [Pontibacter sp. BAB1700]|nr:hypothetical protein O71_13219 [Pontibacter sp. BAB1700]
MVLLPNSCSLPVRLSRFSFLNVSFQFDLPEEADWLFPDEFLAEDWLPLIAFEADDWLEPYSKYLIVSCSELLDSDSIANSYSFCFP